MLMPIIAKMIELVRLRAYCQLIIVFQAGRIQMVHVHQTFKPDELQLADPEILKLCKNSGGIEAALSSK